MPNCPQNVIAFYAVLRLGATVVEHNPLYTAGELHLPFIDHGARVAIVWDKVVPVVESRCGQARPWSTSWPSTSPPAALDQAARAAAAAPEGARRPRQLTTPAPRALAWSGLAHRDRRWRQPHPARASRRRGPAALHLRHDG